MKEKRIEKEIKKAQKKGIYNPKLKLGIVALILVIGTVIGVSYAYYTSNPSTVLNINATVSKKITIEVYSNGNGKVDSMEYATAQTDYNSASTFKLTPDTGYQYKSISCKDTSNQNVTSKVSVSFSNNTLRITPRTINDVTCTVEYERVRTLEEIKADIIRTAKSTSPTSDNFKTGCPLNDGDACSGVYKMSDYQNTSGSLNYTTPGGTSYYFRGEAKDNYVKFANNNWRIVRVNGDGTIRLVLNGDIGTSAFNSTGNSRIYAGYTYYNNPPCTNSNPCRSIEIATNVEESIETTNHGGTNSTIKKKLEAWYYDNLRNYDRYITYGIYCNDTSFGSGSEGTDIYYGAYERGMYNSSKPVTPILTCPDPTAGNNPLSDTSNGNHTYGGVYKLKIGLLSADEIVLAGFKPTTNSPYPTTSNYLYTGSSYRWFWSLSPYYSYLTYARGFYGYLSYRDLNVDDVNTANGVRPVINLSTSGLKATGEGTKDKPFVISQ